jgi:hypothetical protein
MPEVRQLNITGDAAHHYHKSKGLATTRKRGKRAQEAQDGGFDTPSGTPTHNARNLNSARRISNSIGGLMKGGTNQTMPGTNPPNPATFNGPAQIANRAANVTITPATAPPIDKQATAFLPTNPPHPVSTPATMMSEPAPFISPVAPVKGGGSAKGNLTLAPSKKKSRSSVHLAPPAHRGVKTHRKGAHQTRKIRVQLSGLKKRMTKAKTIHKDSREKPIAEVRRLLEEAKLVKPQAQGKPPVPESVLRDIYKDYLLLRNRAL